MTSLTNSGPLYILKLRDGISARLAYADQMCLVHRSFVRKGYAQYPDTRLV